MRSMHGDKWDNIVLSQAMLQQHKPDEWDEQRREYNETKGIVAISEDDEVEDSEFSDGEPDAEALLDQELVRLTLRKGDEDYFFPEINYDALFHRVETSRRELPMFCVPRQGVRFAFGGHVISKYSCRIY